MATKVANLIGPAGPSGDTGLQGNTGPTGSAGPQGNPGSAGPPGVVAISTDAGNIAKAGSDSKLWVPASTIALASTSGAGLLKQISGLTTDFVDGTNNCQDLATASRPLITAVRQNSYNALDNPDFMIDQRNCGSSITIGPGANAAAFLADRWSLVSNTTLNATSIQNYLQPYGLGTEIFMGGYNQITPTGSSAFGQGEFLTLYQNVEGPRFRPLSGGPTSISFYIAASSATSIAVSLVSLSGTQYSWVSPVINLVGDGNPHLVQIPNIPIWPSASSWPTAPGNAAYQIRICFGCGSNYIAGSTGWQAGNYMTSMGLPNPFVVGALLNMFFIQHEPGPVCTEPMDISWEQNYRQCQRYYTKSAPYGTAPNQAMWSFIGPWVGSTAVRTGTSVRWPVELAKTPTVTMYDNTNTPNQIYMDFNGVRYAVASCSMTSPTRFVEQVNLTTTPSGINAGSTALASWTADTGW